MVFVCNAFKNLFWVSKVAAASDVAIYVQHAYLINQACALHALMVLFSKIINVELMFHVMQITRVLVVDIFLIYILIK